MVRQEFDIAIKDLIAIQALPTQIQLAELARDKAYEAIPFTVDDVLRVMRGGGPSLVDKKTISLISSAQNIKSFEADLNKVIKSGKSGSQSSTATAPAAPAAEESETKKRAREAIAAGAPREAVIKRLQGAGEDVSGL